MKVLSDRNAGCIWLLFALALTACAIERQMPEQIAPGVSPDTGLDDAGRPPTAASGTRPASPPPHADAGASAANQVNTRPDASSGALDDAGPRSAGVDAGVVNHPPRVPARHRSAGSTCLADRGPGVDLPQCADRNSGATPGCTRDADCTNGTRGRCLAYGGPACSSACTYDTCSSDSDCPSNQPCECRASTSSSQPNACVTEGDCRVDADCGAGGYCSPSLVGISGSCVGAAACWPDAGGGSCSMYTPATGWVDVPCLCPVSCGHGYFCHTPNDACIDDSDCEAGKSCNYDTEAKHWSCSSSVPPL